MEAARLNEADLRMEMEQIKLASYAADSVKLALQKQRIDSLRTVTPGIPVVVEKDTLFYLYAKRGGHTPQQRAKDVSNVIEALGTRFNLRPDSVYLESTDIVTDLMYGEKVIISFTDQDALWENCTRDQLAASKRHVVVDKLKAMQKEHSLWQLGKRILYFGLIVSLGSSTVIGNIIAGLVITYMRPFKLGDRIKLNDTTGNIIEKTPLVTRIRTPKNEVVTIPNSFIMSSHTVNYSQSAREYGLIIHSEVSIGYDVPWRKTHQLLIEAALNTPGVIDDPRPFVLETSLQDYYPVYQVNAYIRDANSLSQIYSDLHQNIQDVFDEAGIEIMSPHYIATRDGSETTIPKDDLREKKQ